MQDSSIIEGRILWDLKHQRQKYHWDCGLSCVLMVLPENDRMNFLLDFNRICAEEEFNESTWTIDLCYLLRRFGTKYTFCTVTPGVQPGYAGQPFYSRVLHRDQERVTRRFAEATEQGVPVQECSLSTSDLVRHLSHHGPIIVLTDAHKLQCEICKANKLPSMLKCCVPHYQGHYIVLCGYDTVKQMVYYHNPTYKNRVCVMSYSSLDEARTSYGTDEDTILIFSPYIQRGNTLPS